MLKKIFLTVLLSTGLMAVFLSCCKEDKLYWVMTDVITEYSETSGELIITDTTTVDTLMLKLSPEEEYVANNSIDFSALFVSASYATSCPHPGENGLKSNLSSVYVSSDVDFDVSHASGDNLIDICTFNDQSLSDFLSNGLYPFNQILLKINEKPTNSVARRFTIIFTFEDGSELTEVTDPITWN